MQAHVRERFAVELISPRVEQAREARPVLLLFQGAMLGIVLLALSAI